MHKNAIKIVWGGLGSQKLCAFYHKCGAFLVGKNCAPFCALFGQKMCAFEFKIIKNSEFSVKFHIGGKWFAHLCFLEVIRKFSKLTMSIKVQTNAL